MPKTYGFGEFFDSCKFLRLIRYVRTSLYICEEMPIIHTGGLSTKRLNYTQRSKNSVKAQQLESNETQIECLLFLCVIRITIKNSSLKC